MKEQCASDRYIPVYTDKRVYLWKNPQLQPCYSSCHVIWKQGTYLLSWKHSSPTTLCPRNVEIEPKCPNTVLRKNQMSFLIYTSLVMFFLLCRKTITKLQNINVLTKIWSNSFQWTSMNFVQKAEVVGYILTLVRFFHNILQDTVTDKLRKTSLGERRQMWGL